MVHFSAFHVWAVVLLSPSMQNLVVNRFRRRVEAEECFKVLRRLNPEKRYTVMYAPPEKDLKEFIERQLANLEADRSSFVEECSKTLKIVWHRSECTDPPEMETVLGLYKVDDELSTKSVCLGYSGAWWADCGCQTVDPPLWWTDIPLPQD